MKVYVLVVENVFDYDNYREVKVFAHYRDAKEAFEKEVEVSRQNVGYDWLENVSNDNFSTYEDGYYAMNHIEISLLEQEVV